MRKFLIGICALGALSVASAAHAQEVKWQDLDLGKRNQILAEWKRQSASERGPWISYRDEYLEKMSDDEKARYKEKAQKRIAREAEQERVFNEQRKKQMEETRLRQQQAEAEKAQEELERKEQESIETPDGGVETTDTVTNEALAEEAEAGEDTIADNINEPVAGSNDERKEQKQAPEQQEKEEKKGLLNKFF